MSFPTFLITDERLIDILDIIITEFTNAVEKFGSFHNAHEGYAVLLEEVDELWENVKLNQKNPDRIKLIIEEAKQVAAMAIRLIYDSAGEIKEKEAMDK